jgi:hypothetical protein
VGVSDFTFIRPYKVSLSPTSALSALKRHPTFRKFGLEVLKRVKPKPYQRPNMEFECDIWVGISSFHSDDGRQIGENNTGPYPYHEAIATEHKTLKFDGTRQGMPCNMTALRSILPVWNETLQLATQLRQRYFEHKQLKEVRFNLLDAYLYSKMGAALPSFLARRKTEPLADGTLPVLETAFFTLGVGPFMVMRALMEQGNRQCLDPSPKSAEVWYAMADASGSLITPQGYACAGSPNLIREFLDVSMNGTYSGALDSANVAKLFERLGNFEVFYGYVRSSSELELLVKLFHAMVMQNLLALVLSAKASSKRLSTAQIVALRTFIDSNSGLHMDDAQLLENFNARVDILCELMQAVGDATVTNQLQSVGLLTTIAQDAPAETTIAAVKRIASILGAQCATKLQEVHRHLGRPGWGHIAPSDLPTRTFGSDLNALLSKGL